MSDPHASPPSASPPLRKATSSRHLRLTSRAEVAARGVDLRRASVFGVDFRGDPPPGEADVTRAVFLGCQFAPEVEVGLRARGAVVIDAIAGVPFSATRSALYQPEELLEGYDGSLTSTRDYAIYQHFDKHGRNCPHIFDALAQRLHDHAIDAALEVLLDGRRNQVVAIMGGHGTKRDDVMFRRVAELAYLLGRASFFIASGGGPGIMEAANLGAYLAAYEDPAALERALETLARSPSYLRGDQFDDGYIGRAREVREAFPDGAPSLAIPTWFYGHEPTNLFGQHIAKYFSNGLREDTLLAIAQGGVVFAPGSAGTTQEIFMDAAQNHYVTHERASPMVFFGKERYAQRTNLYATARALAEGRPYQELMALFDEPAEVVAFLERHRA